MTPAPISVERLRELLAKATPGPWEAVGWYVRGPYALGDPDRPGLLIATVDASATVDHKENASLIAEGMAALPELLSEVETWRACGYGGVLELKREIERLQAEVLRANQSAAQWMENAFAERNNLRAAERAREEAERDLRAIYEAVPGLPIYATEEDADRATDAFTAICHLCNDYIVSDASGGNTDG